MLGREIITVSSEIHTQHVNAICLQNVLPGGTYSNHWALKREHEYQPLSRSEFSQMKPIAMQYTDVYHLTTGIRSEKCVVRRFRRCASVMHRNYTHLDSTV